MNSSDRTDRYCIIGAGASGLAVAKNFVQRGIAFDCLEREPDIGGLWNFATESGIVYETTHLVSSISSTGFDDLPMLDEDYPEYPSHERVLGYFRDVVRTFGLAPHIELGKVITKVAPRGDKLWEVAVAGEAEPRLYRGVVVASGHHDAPRMPTYPGTFTGETLHSRRYKSPTQVRDRRVLVVGCGNSAADIVSDAVHGRSKVFLSIRRGYWFVPKFIMGFPTGDVLSTVEMIPLPRLVKRWLFQGSLWLLQGPPSRYRMPDPDYAIDQAHPTMTDEIPRLVAHGKLTVKPDVASLDGSRVVFKDGTAEETLNHVGRHELGGTYTDGSFVADGNLTYYVDPSTHANELRIGGDGGLFHMREAPTHPGDFLATRAPEFSTASGGTLMRLTGAPSINADQMVLTAVTPTSYDANVPAATGYFRNPLPMSDGTLVAVGNKNTYRLDLKTGERKK